ncbi:clasp N terminal-domain-containing protein [Chiua virens]|nr:clasp N terminal-domain-containing protein [Chiua virens]
MSITTCDSPETLRTEIDTIRKKVALDETEDTWDTITQGISQLKRLFSIGGCEFPSEMVAGIRSMSRPLNSALNSERSRLSGTAVELVMALATGLGPSFEPLVSQFFPTLLVLCGRTNKVFTSRARNCVLAVIQHTRLPSLLPFLAELAHHKSVFPRLTAAEGILACLNCFNPPDLEKETRARIVEDFIKLTARDASADVRKASKEVFKAYKVLMPARVESFIMPLTPVIKKYLDIQTGSSGTHVTSNLGHKQTSRPSSRANNGTADVGQRPASSSHSKPPTRPTTEDTGHSSRQRPGIHGPSSVVEVRGPRQRTTSQMQRDPSQPPSLHINVQSSSAAQRCAVPPSAPARQVMQHPPPAVARGQPVRSGGPQRPPPNQMKLNPPFDRLKVPGNGAKRIPLPPVPAPSGSSSEQVAVMAPSTAPLDRPDSTAEKPRPRLPTNRKAEQAAPGKLAVGRKVFESTQSVSVSTKPTNGPAKTVPLIIPRKPSVKVEKSNPTGGPPLRRPAGNLQKGTRPLLKAERKETSPTLVPLPPSPSTSPMEIPLPPSPDRTPHSVDSEGQNAPAPMTLSGSTDVGENQPGPVAILQEKDMPSTPITTLLSSIQRGFLFTPSSPLSPPQNYLQVPCEVPEKRQDAVTMGDFTKAPLGRAPFCLPVEGDTITDNLDRHALRDLN